MTKVSNRYVHLDSHRQGEARPTAPLVFVQMADTQIGIRSTYRVPGEEPVKGWDVEMAACRRAFHAINRRKPDFAIICGDLTDEFPTTGKQDVLEAQRRDFKSLLDIVDPEIPILCLCGNHDLGNRPNAVTVEKYVSEFGDDYFTFDTAHMQGIAINSQLFYDSADCAHLLEAHRVWLNETLKTIDKTKQLIIFSHIAPFIQNPEEPNGYFNLPMDIRRELLDLFHDAGARAWFAGHFHRNAGGWFKDMEVVVTGSVSCMIGTNEEGVYNDKSGLGPPLDPEESGVRIVQVRAQKEQGGQSVTHDWVTLREFEECVRQLV